MKHYDTSTVVWLAWLGLFLLLELLGLLTRVPWSSLSAWVWRTEDLNGAVRWVILVGLAVLMTHLVARWP